MEAASDGGTPVAAFMIVAVGAMARFPAVAYAWFRTFLARRRFVSFQFGWIEVLTNFEPVVLLITGYLLFRTIAAGPSPAPLQPLSAILGAAFVLVGWAFQIWVFLSWTSLFAGHGVVEGQPLMTHGAYAVVRRPAYLGICLVWLGLGVAFASPAALVIAAVYSIPIWLLHLRAEESMMLESFGDEYRESRPRLEAPPDLDPSRTTNSQVHWRWQHSIRPLNNALNTNVGTARLTPVW